MKHGAKVKKCRREWCPNKVQRGGLCVKHGAKVKKCRSEGCPNKVVKGGVCMKHGAKPKRCSSEWCTNYAKKGGVCQRHGVERKLCRAEGCKNQTQCGGVCKRHRKRWKTIQQWRVSKSISGRGDECRRQVFTAVPVDALIKFRWRYFQRRGLPRANRNLLHLDRRIL